MFELQTVSPAFAHPSIAYIQRGIHEPLMLGHDAQQGAEEGHDAYAVLATPNFHDCAFRIGSFPNKKRPETNWV